MPFIELGNASKKVQRLFKGEGEMRLTSYLRSVRRLFRKAEAQTLSVALQTGVRCREKCGACCLSSGVETSPIEMISVVRRLREDGRLEESLKKAESLPERSPCVLYRHVEGNPLEGQCTVYEDRPLICRLFGFSGRIEKTGELQMAFCKFHKEDFPQQTQEARLIFEASEKIPPVMSTYRMSLKAAVPQDSLTQLMPINHALLKAAEIEFFDSLKSRELIASETPRLSQPKMDLNGMEILD